MASLEPSRRRSHFSAASKSSFYVWGGETVPAEDLQYLHVFNSGTEAWSHHLLKGQHPPGIHSGASAMLNQCFYTFGGFDFLRKHTGSLFELNMETLSWREASPPVTNGPKKKAFCDMVEYGSILILFGGDCDPFLSYNETNELHAFDTTTGTWSSPQVTGQVPPPCNGFTFTKVSQHKVVLHGEMISLKRENSTATFMLDLSTMHWMEIKTSTPEPSLMIYHAAVCLGFNTEHAQLLVFGSYFNENSKWLLDISAWKWTEVPTSNEQLHRCSHSAAIVYSTSKTEEVVIFGGYKPYNFLSDTTVLRWRKLFVSRNGVLPAQWMWCITDIISGQQLRKTKRLENKRKLIYEMPIKGGATPNLDITSNSRMYTNSKDDAQSKSDTTQERDCDALHSSDTYLNQIIDTSEDTESLNKITTNKIDEPKISHEDEFFGDVMKAIAGNQHIRKKMANIILQGLPGSGKTSLLDRLLNRPILPYYCSTGVSEAIVIVDISPTSTLSAAHAYDDSTWKVIDFDESVICQLDCLKLGSFEIKEDFLVGDCELHDNNFKYNVSEVCFTSDVEDHVKTVLKKYDIKNIRDLQTTNSLYIRDTGGQVEFQESLSLLIYGPSIFILVMKTNIDINTKHVIQYRSPTGEVVNTYESSISTMDALLQFLTSVSAIQTTEDGVFQSHKPVVFIVGTHIDQLGPGANDIIDKINESLDNVIRSKKFLNLVHYADAGQRKVMYLVDNTCEDDNNFQLLRSSVSKYISGRNEFTIQYPVSYLLFCLELQSLKETVITMENCIKLAAMFGIGRSDIKHLLHFLHFRVGIIQHYDVEGLSDLIIKEPEVLFKKVTDLLVKTFLSSGSLNTSEQESFCEKGILEASAFENILSYDDKIKPKQFLCFLLHLRMAIPFADRNGHQKYFIPSVLNHVQTLSSDEKKTDIAPLAITFKHGSCPKGLLGMLISYLMNPEKTREITFDLMEDHIYQDQVSLLAHSTEDMDEVYLKRHLSHIEIKVFLQKSSNEEELGSLVAPRGKTPTKVCSDIHAILKDCLEQSLKTLHYDSKKVGPIFCLVCPHENCVQFHAVKEGKHFHYVHCTTNNVKLQLPKSARHWFNEDDMEHSSTSCSKIDSKKFHQATKPVVLRRSIHESEGKPHNTKAVMEVLSAGRFSAADGASLGIALGVESSIISNISMNSRSVQNQLIGIVDHWLRNASNPTWNELACALQNCNYKQLANSICGIKHPPGKLLTTNNIIEVLNSGGFSAAESESLGLFLGVEPNIISNIQTDHSRSVQNQLIYIINHWLKNDPNPTWEDLAEVLKKCNYRRLANTICGKKQPGDTTLCGRSFHSTSGKKIRVLVIIFILGIIIAVIGFGAFPKIW